MKLLPHSKIAKVRASVVFVVFVGVCIYRNVFSLWQLMVYAPQEGDIVFQSLPHGDLVDAIEGVTHSPWSHCGVVMRSGSHWQVVEAIGQVRRTPLASWVMRGRAGRFAAYRVATPLPPEAKLSPSLSSALSVYMGRPYDYRYAPGDAEIYCSELVFKAYRDAFGLEIGEWEELGTLNWRPFEGIIRGMENNQLPLQRRMITPVGLTRSPLVNRVYPKGA